MSFILIFITKWTFPSSSNSEKKIHIQIQIKRGWKKFGLDCRFQKIKPSNKKLSNIHSQVFYFICYLQKMYLNSISQLLDFADFWRFWRKNQKKLVPENFFSLVLKEKPLIIVPRNLPIIFKSMKKFFCLHFKPESSQSIFLSSEEKEIFQFVKKNRIKNFLKKRGSLSR